MSQTVCECRSPQEQRLLDKIEGKVDRFRATHERVFRMLERFDGMKPRIDIERALYFTQSMQETEGQPLVLRWAKSKKWFKKMEEFALSIGMKGLGYVKVRDDLTFDGPIDKFLKEGDREELISRNGSKAGDVIYFIADTAQEAPKLAGQIRTEVAKRLDLIDTSRFEMCFIVDFPMFERDEETNQIIFTHNPFSMPQGGLDSLLNKDPEEVLAYQYDIVCNGVELSSGAVRNHDIEIMKKAFELAGYSEDDLKAKFSALYNAFQYGAPPHAGMAPGVDRMIMLLTEEENIREVIAFPMNSNAQDLLLGSPGEVTEQQLREVHIKLR